MTNERLYIVTYDISDSRRWRQVYKIIKGYGSWLQLSVFQCCLNDRRRAELGARLDHTIHHDEDHVLIIDVGPAHKVTPKVESLGRPYQVNQKQAIIV